MKYKFAILALVSFWMIYEGAILDSRYIEVHKTVSIPAVALVLVGAAISGCIAGIAAGKS